jgi:hypothetical protein
MFLLSIGTGNQSLRLICNFLKYGTDILIELIRVFRHWEMTQAVHFYPPGTGNFPVCKLSPLPGSVVVVLSIENINRNLVASEPELPDAGLDVTPPGLCGPSGSLAPET